LFFGLWLLRRIFEEFQHLPRNEEIGAFLDIAAKNFELFSKTQDQNKKIKNL
jgi:hypothetical protein